jgi:activator of HSP90 ATPase
MNKIANPAVSMPTQTRRQAIVGVVALGGLIAGARVSAQMQQPAMKQIPATNPSSSRTAIHQEIELKAPPQRIYEILLSSKDFTAFSGVPADIDPKAGGTFSMFGGMIVGRNIELIPAQQIVQAWRPADWPTGLYSLVRFQLKPNDSGSLLILDHTSFPAGGYDHLSSGWSEHYWGPLKKFLS